MVKCKILTQFALAILFLFAGSSFAGEVIASESFAEESFAEETFAAETFAEEVFSSGHFDNGGRRVETLKVEEMEDRYKGKYDIDWPKVIAQFGVGASVVVVTGTIGVVAGAVGAEPVAAIAFASARGAATGCVSGAAIGGGLQGLIETIKNGDFAAASKGVIEGAAEGCMWGAFIGAATFGWGKFKAVKTIGQDLQSPKAIPKNTTYRVGGYTDNGTRYVTDEYARIKGFSANLRLTKANPRGSKGVEPKIGKQMECGVGGHLVGNQFGGTGGYENLVPMSRSVNSSVYKKLENEWAKELKKGKSVSVTGDILYSGTSSVPTEFVIKYIIDGVVQPTVRIPNACP